MRYPLRVLEYGYVEIQAARAAAGSAFGGWHARRPRLRVFRRQSVFVHQPWGLFGGEAGATGQFRLQAKDGATRRLADPIVRQGESVIVDDPGAGGVSARRVPAEHLAEDEKSASFTRLHGTALARKRVRLGHRTG